MKVLKLNVLTPKTGISFLAIMLYALCFDTCLEEKPSNLDNGFLLKVLEAMIYVPGEKSNPTKYGIMILRCSEGVSILVNTRFI